MRNIGWKRILIIAWACALMFGLVYQAEVAEAAHSDCSGECAMICGAGNCFLYSANGCGCTLWCEDGTKHRTICT